MNQVIKELIERKSVRVFTDQEIEKEKKQWILEAAVQAPTAGNQQMYTILDITDQKKKELLADSCDHQPFIAKAKMLLIFCADFRKWYDAFLEAGCEPRKPAPGDLFIAMDDALIAAQNAVTAAESLGIGSCYIGDIMEQYEFHRELLKLPEYVFPAAMIVFGYPTEQQMKREKPKRCPIEYIVHENSYHEMHGEELKELLSQKPGKQTYEEWIHAFCNRKYNSDFSKEMSRSVTCYLDMFLKNKE